MKENGQSAVPADAQQFTVESIADITTKLQQKELKEDEAVVLWEQVTASNEETADEENPALRIERSLLDQRFYYYVHMPFMTTEAVEDSISGLRKQFQRIEDKPNKSEITHHRSFHRPDVVYTLNPKTIIPVLQREAPDSSQEEADRQSEFFTFLNDRVEQGRIALGTYGVPSEKAMHDTVKQFFRPEQAPQQEGEILAKEQQQEYILTDREMAYYQDFVTRVQIVAGHNAWGLPNEDSMHMIIRKLHKMVRASMQEQSDIAREDKRG